jgi:iron complex transport system substrate-binding protein
LVGLTFFEISDNGLAARFNVENLREIFNLFIKVRQDLSFVFWFSSASPSADAYVGGKNSASGFIANVLGRYPAPSGCGPDWRRQSHQGSRQ